MPGLLNRLPILLFLCWSLHPLWPLEGLHGPGHPDPGFKLAGLSTASNHSAAPPARRKTPCQECQDGEAMHQTTAAADDLAGNLDHRRTERL